MLEELFKLIKCQLKKECCFVTDVAMYQQQDLFQENNLGYKPTVCFIDFQNINYSNLGYYEQQCELEVVVRVVVEEYTKNYFKALKQKDAVVKALQYYLNLSRISESIDTNADALYVFTITFSASFCESLEPELTPIGGTSGHSWYFDMSLSQDSNGDGTYTGFASTSGGVIK